MLARASLQRKNKYNIADSLRSIIVYSEFWSDTAGVRTLEHTKHNPPPSYDLCTANISCHHKLPSCLW